VKKDAAVLAAVKLASAKSASLVHAEMKRGLSSLAFIRSTAPWVGVFGVLRCIYDSLGGMRSESTTLMAVVMGGVPEGLALFALSLIVSLMATLCRAYLLTEVEAIGSEMGNASLQLINDLDHLQN
jgi:biopolymer transport protein ExbB/TolQ